MITGPHPKSAFTAFGGAVFLILGARQAGAGGKESVRQWHCPHHVWSGQLLNTSMGHDLQCSGLISLRCLFLSYYGSITCSW